MENSYVVLSSIATMVNFITNLMSKPRYKCEGRKHYSRALKIPKD